MPEGPDQQSPEVLKQIQAAERKVERMVRAAEEEARALIEKAQAQAKALVDEKRRTLEERKKISIAEGSKESEREAEQIIVEAQAKANKLKAQGMARLAEAVGVVLQRILPR